MTFSILIPARKGSKTVKNKNIKKLKGKPLAEYTFNSIKNLRFKKFILTDDNRIKKIAQKFNINTDYKRPKILASDKTSLIDTVTHFLKWAKSSKQDDFATIVILQVTSPMRSTKHIKNAINYYKKNSYKSLFSISESSEHPYETIDLKKNGKWKLNFPESKKFYRRQDYALNSYFINGAIYMVDKEYFIKKRKLISKKHGLFKMNKIHSIDIDDDDDFKIAKGLL